LNHPSCRPNTTWEILLTDKLNLMDTFPSIALTSSEDETIKLPDDIHGAYAIVLFYRGHW